MFLPYQEVLRLCCRLVHRDRVGKPQHFIRLKLLRTKYFAAIAMVGKNTKRQALNSLFTMKTYAVYGRGKASCP